MHGVDRVPSGLRPVPIDSAVAPRSGRTSANIELNLKLSQRAPEGPTKVVGSGAQLCCLGNGFRGAFGVSFQQL